MKKVILGTALMFMALASQACNATQGDKVPSNVKQAFAKKFPDAKKVKWDKENDTEWEAEFKMGKVEYSANFLMDGTWKETEHEIKKTEIPEAVLSTLKKEFPDFKIEEAEISETATGSHYELEIEKGENTLEVAIDGQGTLVSKETMDEDDED
ncbi:MAG: hypothetical protein CL868_16680 [Cytophagaceae bacterium]|nr:hypothetical protein [Cytophagaceae bacterium]|tara:strand:+ start:4337 stop:4798 length:462 start_codon:yes stop_codon:yes gene_type:complete